LKDFFISIGCDENQKKISGVKMHSVKLKNFTEYNSMRPVL